VCIIILIALENEAVPQAAIADSTNHFPLINTLWESEVDLACSVEGLQMFGGEFQIQAGTRALLGPCCDPACWETDFNRRDDSCRALFLGKEPVHSLNGHPRAVGLAFRRDIFRQAISRSVLASNS
jgi:hypothetical protein